MDLLNSLLDAGKKMATDAMMQQTAGKAEQGADTVLNLLFQIFTQLDAGQKSELFKLFQVLLSQVTGSAEGLSENAWETFKSSPLVKQMAGQLAEQAVKQLSQQFLS